MLLTGCASGLLIAFRQCNKRNKANKNKNTTGKTTTIDDNSSTSSNISDDDDDSDNEENEIINDDNASNNNHSFHKKFTNAKWDTSAITLQTLKRIKRSMRSQNVSINNNDSNAKGNFTTTTTASTTTPYQPRFYMTHDHHRITSIAFALYDTRIVVGLANGHLYVWAASPGLNRREGRLLARVHVPLHGCYPVVALTCNELKANNDANYLQ